MENIVEALKLFFGVTVFAIALSVFFQMTALAKDTSDIVFAAIDETTFINYNADTRDEGKRVVTFQEIIPTIYRYAREAYGVTIIDNGKIVARFDLDTESQVSNCDWKNEWFGDKAIKSNTIKTEIIEYYNKYIAYNVAGVSNIADIEELDSIMGKIYFTGDYSKPVFTGWETSNTFGDNHITQRVNCDIYGRDSSGITDSDGITRFSIKNQGVNQTDPDKEDEVIGQHRAVCSGRGLLADYGSPDITFTEYIVQIDRNEYIADEDGNNTGLLVFGTLRNTKKREIVYVKE